MVRESNTAFIGLIFCSIVINCFSMENPSKNTFFSKIKDTLSLNKKVVNESICGICQENLPQDWPKRIDLCISKDGKTKHSFCTACIIQWIGSSEKAVGCPFCRNSISLGKEKFILGSFGFTRYPEINQGSALNVLKAMEIEFDRCQKKQLDTEKQVSEAHLSIEQYNNRICELSAAVESNKSVAMNYKTECTRLENEKDKLRAQCETIKQQLELTRDSHSKCPSVWQLERAESNAAWYRKSTKVLGITLVGVGAYAIYKYRNS